ncbi:hypothetical protein BJF85_20130 [Saccharomonospora sp. CUA-673]|uniref:WXG100 family type VII secretion target n=1 Tax=Saccharomonospora sp. CUA-673 TaxID=1904969 RepID=UPI0009626618|nr:hypothetical protein [Saccharomonospora sp. CUA-673]OLT44192.1 hypothetical protein BJF85_20130 [Saccharomonospora sp. CUA-673]
MFVNPDVAAEATGFPALGFNPAPGEPPAVGAGARQYSGIAEKLHHAHEAIQSIITQRGMWEGEASEAFTRRVGDLPEYLDAATGSMNKAAEALTQWAGTLAEMRRAAEELERQAKKAKEELEAAEANPAFELANQWFDNAQALQSAQTALGNAATQVDSAANRLAEIMDAAERLQAQHRDIAEQVAATLDEARQLAPDEPGLVGKMLDGLSGWSPTTPTSRSTPPKPFSRRSTTSSRTTPMSSVRSPDSLVMSARCSDSQPSSSRGRPGKPLAPPAQCSEG